MARPAKGQVIPPEGKARSWAIRFRAYGQRRYVTLGRPEDGWDRERAEAELRHVLADVERGLWRPHEPEPVQAPAEQPTFHEFASEWLEARRPELRPRTIEDYEWALSYHLLPFFKDHRLSEITVEEVDRYRNAKVREDKLSANSVNRTIARLAQILEVAVEYGHIARNPARGRRRLKGTTPQRRWLETEHVAPLLAAAGELDAKARRNDPGGRRAMLATLTLAGLRVGELTALRWRDVDLANGRLHVGESKTDAGRRTVDLSPDLRDELATHKAGSDDAEPDRLVFTTATGRSQDRNNVRQRILLRAVDRANEHLAKREEPLIPDGLAPHSLRRTFASLLFEAGATVPYVMAQLGHTDPKVTLGIYAHVLRRRGDTGARMDALVRGSDWAETGRITASDPRGGEPAEDTESRDPSPHAGL